MIDIIGELNKYPEGYWDFKGKTKTGIHNIGKYPATMVPDMQYELLNIIIKQLGDKDIKLLDPFCGSGTSLVIAQELGIDSVGIDVNPYATLLSSVKTSIFDRKKLLFSINKIESDLNKEQEFKVHYFNNIEKWFRKDIINSLSKIRHCIIAEEDVIIRNFFWVCLSEAIFKFSNDRSSTFKLHVLPEDKINIIQDDCIEFFLVRVKENAGFLRYANKSNAKVKYGDCCEVMNNVLSEKFKIICTSPPYGDNSTTVTYGQASILFLKWIDGEDLPCEPYILDKYSTIDRISIGGEKRSVCNTNKIKSLDEFLDKISVSKRKKVINFFEDYFMVLKCMENCLIDDGYLLMTVGNRSIDGMKQPLDDITIEIAKLMGLKFIYKFNRNILYKKIPRTLLLMKKEKIVKSISKETILIFKK